MNETQDHTTEGGATAGAAGTEPAAAVAGSGTDRRPRARRRGCRVRLRA